MGTPSKLKESITAVEMTPESCLAASECADAECRGRATPASAPPGVRITWAELLEDMEVVQEAFHAFFSADHEWIHTQLLPLAKSRRSLYGSLGMGVLLLVRGLLTLAEEDVAEARKHLDDAAAIASGMRRTLAAETVHSRMGQISSRRKRSISGPLAPEFHSISEERRQETVKEHVRRHVDLVTAECYLARALLTMLTDSMGIWSALTREALNIRAAHLIYHEARARLATTEKNQWPDVRCYKGAVLLGSGIIDIVLCLLPPRMASSLFGCVGYTGNLAVGISQLRMSYAEGVGLRRVWAGMMLCFYHCTLTGTLAPRQLRAERRATDLHVLDASTGPKSSSESGAEDEEVRCVREVIWKGVREYPACPVFRQLQARYLVRHGRIDAARAVLDYSVKAGLDAAELSLHQAAIWELLKTCMVQLDWSRCLELAEALVHQTGWSTSFALFLQAAFLRASKGTVVAEDTKQLITNLLQQVPLHLHRTMGPRLSVEEYAARRAKEFLKSGKMVFYPEYELMLVWDGFVGMDLAGLSRVESDLDSIELSNGDLSPCCLAIGRLCRASLRRARGAYIEAIELLDGVLLDHGGADPLQREADDSYVIPAAHAERSQIALEMGDLETAERHYDLSVGYPKRYLLQHSMHLCHVKIRAEMGRRLSTQQPTVIP